MLAVVPARGGSKGIPLKNIYPIAGKPLIAHVRDVVDKVPEIDRVVVSTDHDDVAAVAEAAGLDVPFRRPDHLSSDRIADVPVLQHALECMESIDETEYQVIVMLQPTSPLRTADHVRSVIARLVDEDRDAVWTVSRTDLKYHPLKQLTVNEAGQLAFFDARAEQIVARQQLNPVFHRNGAAYALSRTCLVDQQSIMGSNSAAVILEEPMISIDTLDDVAQIETILRARRDNRK